MPTNTVNGMLAENGYDITMERWITMSRLWQGECIPQQYFADVRHKNKAAATGLLHNMKSAHTAHERPA